MALSDHEASPVPGVAGSAGAWTIDPGASAARFEMTYLVIATLRGTLGSIEGTIHLDGDDLERSSVSASIRVATLTTGNRLRDAHLRSAEFFDAKRFPVITFRSRRVERVDIETLHVIGDLTIRDVTNEVTLETTYREQLAGADGERHAGFKAITQLSRREFGLGTRTAIEAAIGAVASDHVAVTLEISAIESQP